MTLRHYAGYQPQDVGSTGGEQGRRIEPRDRPPAELGAFPGNPEKAAPPSVELERSIADSRSLLRLPDDWDGEGAKAIQETTWRRAVAFLREQAAEARKRALTLPTPSISPGPDGSIDLHWRLERFELLANVPEHPMAPMMYYGDDHGDQTAKGSLPPGKTRSVLFALWLAHNR